jgi:uncharacterized protein YbjT (DUF2867 family)
MRTAGKRKILITGASGNVGYETIRGLKEIGSQQEIIAGVRNPKRAENQLAAMENLSIRKIDFENPATFKEALEGIDVVFLLRPPNLADIPRYFEPFIASMQQKGINKIVFLSVQGVENQKFIPHYKIEKLILDRGLEYVFLRPGYFMQNLTSTLLPEIKKEGKIFIPSGNLKLNWVDVRDIGLVGAHILNDFESFKDRSYEITGSEFEDFNYAANILSHALGKNIKYESPNLLKFYIQKRKLGIDRNMIFVMIMLHYFPRFGRNKQKLTNTVNEITGREPIKLRDFVERNKEYFE